MKLPGATAIVTGASRGIGRGIARAFWEADANVVAVARTETALEQLAEELDGSRCLPVVADVTSEEDMVRAVASATDRFGAVDVLCHNAGIYPEVTLAEMTRDDWDEVLETNLTSTFLAVKASQPVMQDQRRGRIVLISSITGVRVGYPGLSHYGATKAGMAGFMRGAALELAPFGITINAIEPGSIRTEGLADLGDEAIASMERHIPLGHLGEPADIAAASLFLASDGARFITGQTIVVDGGQTLPELPL
jgi:3-oxoacyl-[acyl-carrier protein] reductase